MTIGYILDSSRVVYASYIREEITELQQQGHTIVIVPLRPALSWEAEIPERLKDVDALPESPGFTDILAAVLHALVTITPRKLGILRFARRYVGWRRLGWTLWAASALRARKPDRLHSHYAGTASVRAMVLSRILGIPFSCITHGSDILLRSEPFLADLIDFAQPFITISQYNKNLLAEYNPGSRDNISVLHCGVNLSKFKPEPRPVRPQPVLLSVTWLIEIKGITYLLQACELLKKQGRRFECRIVGGSPDEEDVTRTRNEIEALNLGDVVVLVDRIPHDQVITEMQNADCFVLPSLSEGIPVSLMEAMAMMLPVVATRITGIPELVDDEINGFLVEPSDAPALADRMARLLDDPDLRHRIGIAAREKIERAFNVKTLTEDLEQLFEKNSKAHCLLEKQQAPTEAP